MASAKAWYWIALGVLALSFGSSNTGRCLRDRALATADRLYQRSMPYVAMAEAAFGRTEADYGHMEATIARAQTQQACLQAEQARVQARMIREQVRTQVLVANRVLRENRELVTPQVLVDTRELVRSVPQVVVCPRVKVAVPRIPTPPAPVVEDPI